MRFIFVPVPEKETLFYKDLKTARPVFLDQLVFSLRQLGIEVVDTPKAFMEAFQNEGVLLHHLDDTHWNAEAIRLTADLLRDLIREDGS